MIVLDKYNIFTGNNIFKVLLIIRFIKVILLKTAGPHFDHGMQCVRLYNVMRVYYSNGHFLKLQIQGGPLLWPALFENH